MCHEKSYSSKSLATHPLKKIIKKHFFAHRDPECLVFSMFQGWFILFAGSDKKLHVSFYLTKHQRLLQVWDWIPPTKKTNLS